jgi:nucleotide-binding universal stress UspA family protein
MNAFGHAPVDPSAAPGTVRPDPAERARTIVVGVDGGPSGDYALRWAYDEAVARGYRLDVVHVFTPPPIRVALVGMPPYVPEPRDPEPALRDAVLRSLPEQRDVDVTIRVVRGAHAPALVEASRGAALLVVASQGSHTLERALLGSTSTYAVHHATCPVVVLPVRRAKERPETAAESRASDAGHSDHSAHSAYSPPITL